MCDRQRSDGADTISQSTKHQKIEPLTSAVSASYGLGVACFWSIIKSIFFISIGKNHVGYYYIAKVINTLFILEKDIIVYIQVPDIGQLVDCVLIAALPRSLQLINRTAYCVLLGVAASSNNIIISGFSAGIIVQAKQVSNDLDLFNQTTFRSYRKSVIQSYKYNEAQFLVSTGNSLNIGLSQFKSITPEKVISLGQRQKKAVVPEAVATSAKGTSINTPQWRLPQTMLSNGETVTLLLTVRSDSELEHIIACSLAQIDVSHNLVLSLHIAIYQNGPQAVENPNQNLRTSSTLYFYVAYFISAASASVAVSVPLKFVLDLANSRFSNVPFVKLTLFNYIPIVLAGMVIVQLTQQVQTQQHVALPLAPSGALVYLVPPEVKVFLGQSKNSCLDDAKDQGSIVKVLSTSFSAEYDETQSECDAFDKRAKQFDALNDIY
ncbi:MAG: hypothetical protein EZS28_017726 [Streblomastix strix]|uniref:Uncharacterized protein n=1 Tax=Streblomastix strix TaxID=222440 RepID=A0A5J4VW02_9EUKA|nr:MAG: hypothetical protein EZS28_017726 [Streblomastix strix]